MFYLLQALPIALPVLFWGYYHYHKDRHLPEPVSHLVLTFVLGIAAAAVSKGLYVALGWVSLRYDAVLLADTDTLALFVYAMLAARSQSGRGRAEPRSARSRNSRKCCRSC